MTVDAFTQDTGVAACNSFTYFATNDDSTPLDPIFTFNPTTRQLSFQTSDVAKVKLYKIMITGYIFDPNKFETLVFNVDIRDNCENVAFTPSPDATTTYREKDPAQLINGFNF